MGDITNLTDRITHLRDHSKSSVISKQKSFRDQRPLSDKSRRKSERKFAADIFMMVSYSLLGAALLSQVFLIIWLDII